MNEVSSLRSFDSPRPADSPAKVHDAAQQFEALLIGQILKSVRESAGSSSDPSADSAMGYAEEQLASVLAHNGGLGLATVIEAGLKRLP
jgi:Rod binding domain-containing protein